jgi:hypothetical protein
MGNDLNANHDQDGAYTVGATLDLHYAYLVGLKGRGGWPDWDPNGSFVNILSDSAKRHNTTPMYTLYGMRAEGENNLTVLTNDAYMTAYWASAKLLYQRIAIFGEPAVVQLEPDFWGFLQKANADPTKQAVKVTLEPDCAALPNDVTGLARCLVKLGRQYAPKAAIGLHASEWAAGTAQGVADYFKLIHASDADFISTDLLDRDAGCFEAHVDPECQRGGTTGWYLDESNATKPNFKDHFAWAKTIHDVTGGMPIMWWQLPFGVPSATPGGTAGKYRDNKVKYLFAHMDELIAAGGFAAAFGTGAGNQTYITTDGGQFKNAVAAYYAKPAVIP